MRNFNLLPLLFGLVILASAGAGAEESLRGKGDFEFFVDIASLPAFGERTIEFFQIAIPTKEVEYKEKDGSYLAAVRIELTLKNKEGTVYSKGYKIRDEKPSMPVENDLSGFFYLTDSCLVAPGEYLLDIKIEDIQRKKRNLLALLRKNYFMSELKDANIRAMAFSPDRLALSDPVFIWSRMGGDQFVPNPIQIYGLKNDTLSFFISGLLPESSPDDSLDVQLTVLARSGELMDVKQLKAGIENRRAKIFGIFDVNTYPSGTYRIIADASAVTGLNASTGKDFSVVWELLNWQRPRRDVLVEARILLSDKEFEDFQKSSIGEQESILNSFWKNLDPTPHTAINEKYDVFIERVRYADGHFKGYVRGALTDRGQIFIRFGAPNDILEHSVPKTREDLLEAIDKLEDEYKVVVHSYDKVPGIFSLTRIYERSKDGKPFRGMGADAGAYELWIYNLRGEPILERDRLMTVHSGLRFLFVDKDGIGNYQLVGTSEEFLEGQE